MGRPKHRLYLESRYRKLVRGLPQTIFWCPSCKGHRRRRVGCGACGGRGKLTDDSVQELLARRILPAFRARSGRFHGAGREDVDVRMLGRGRPFVFEVVAPRREDVDLDALLARFHETAGDRVRCAPFRRVDRHRVREIKQASWAKRYLVGVAFDAPITAAQMARLEGRQLEIDQRTPVRVVHRRADLTRRRLVVVRAVRPAADVGVELEIETAHGTYVKEWVSGDGGRSRPSLTELCGAPAVCARLDVLDILTGDDPRARIELSRPTDVGG